MPFCSKSGVVGPTRSRNVSSILPAFIAFSILAHGLALLLSAKPATQLPERQFGTIISTILSSANNEPVKLSSHSSPAPTPQQPGPSTKSAAATIIMAAKPKLMAAHRAEVIPDQTPNKTQKALLPISKTNTTTKLLANQHQKMRAQQRNYLLGELQNRLSRYLTYPQRARRRGWHGQVMVAFHINNHGQLNNVRLAKSSGYPLLDYSAVAAITKLDHITLPDRLGPLLAMEMLLPVRYQLREG